VTFTDLYTPTLSIISETYAVDNVTVTVEWTQKLGVMYTTRIIPQAASLSIGSNSQRLTLSYNTGYNFSVLVADTPCDPVIAAFIQLNYGKID
jgi:lipoprotein signal peptidase